LPLATHFMPAKACVRSFMNTSASCAIFMPSRCRILSLRAALSLPSLLSLSTPQLHRPRLLLPIPLAQLHRRCARDGLSAEIAPVALFRRAVYYAAVEFAGWGGGGEGGLVEPKSNISATASPPKDHGSCVVYVVYWYIYVYVWCGVRSG